MEKLRIVPRDAMLFRMLHRNWMSPSDVARILHCKPTEAYNRVRRIANKRRLIAMRIDGEKEEKIIVIRPSTKTTILRFVSILPP